VLQNPRIDGIEPRRGPVDGGTSVTLLGVKLNTGADRFVRFAGHLCNVTRYVEHWIFIMCYWIFIETVLNSDSMKNSSYMTGRQKSNNNNTTVSTTTTTTPLLLLLLYYYYYYYYYYMGDLTSGCRWHRGSRLWNSLPHEVTSASSLPVFCSRLKTYFFQFRFQPTRFIHQWSSSLSKTLNHLTLSYYKRNEYI